jgi:hypothetical protein
MFVNLTNFNVMRAPDIFNHCAKYYYWTRNCEYLSKNVEIVYDHCSSSTHLNHFWGLINVCPPPHLQSHLTWRRQQVPLNRCSLSDKLHAVTFQKTVNLILITVTIWNRTRIMSCLWLRDLYDGVWIGNWIYWSLLVQSLVITINYSAIANLPTSQITRTC